MKNKREYDCSVNLLGKPPGKERSYIRTRCTESQEYISFTVGKFARIFHILEVKFKTSFQFGIRGTASFKQSYKLCERGWIRQLPVKEQTGFENATGIFQLYIPVGDKRLWNFKLSILRHYIADYIICGLVTASHLERPEARLKLYMHQGQNKELFEPVLQSSKLTEFKAMLTSYVLKTTLLILGRGKHSNTEILRGHWLSWHRQKKRGWSKLVSILLFFVFQTNQGVFLLGKKKKTLTCHLLCSLANFLHLIFLFLSWRIRIYLLM